MYNKVHFSGHNAAPGARSTRPGEIGLGPRRGINPSNIPKIKKAVTKNILQILLTTKEI